MNKEFYKKNFANLHKKEQIRYCIDIIMETHAKINEKEIERKTGYKQKINTNFLTKNAFFYDPQESQSLIKRKTRTMDNNNDRVYDVKDFDLDINLNVDPWFNCKPCRKMMMSSSLGDEYCVSGRNVLVKNRANYYKNTYFKSNRIGNGNINNGIIENRYTSWNKKSLNDSEEQEDLLHGSWTSPSYASSSTSPPHKRKIIDTIVYFDVGTDFFGSLNNNIIDIIRIKSKSYDDFRDKVLFTKTKACTEFCKRVLKLLRFGVKIYFFITRDAYQPNDHVENQTLENTSMMKTVTDILKNTFSKSLNVEFYDTKSGYEGYSRSELNYLTSENSTIFRNNILITTHPTTGKFFSNRNGLVPGTKFTYFKSIQNCTKYIEEEKQKKK